MSQLSQTAAKIAVKYIKQISPENIIDTRKKRGLQAEINKLDAIRRVLLNHNIDEAELLRFRAEVNKLLYTVDEKMTLYK